MAKVKLVLHGHLKDLHSEDIFVEAKTARAAISSLRMIKAFNPEYNRNRYLCKVKDVNQALDLDDALETDVLHIYCEGVVKPGSVLGAGNNPYVRIIIGVILIIIGVYLYTTGADGTAVVKTGMALASAGLSLVIGGVSQLLMKDQKVEDEDGRSKSLTNYANTVKSGTPIPLLLGEHIHGGHIFSLNTETRYGKELDISDFKSRYNPENSEFNSWLLLYDGTEDQTTDQRPPGGGGGGGGGGNPHYPQVEK